MIKFSSSDRLYVVFNIFSHSPISILDIFELSEFFWSSKEESWINKVSVLIIIFSSVLFLFLFNRHSLISSYCSIVIFSLMYLLFKISSILYPFVILSVFFIVSSILRVCSFVFNSVFFSVSIILKGWWFVVISVWIMSLLSSFVVSGSLTFSLLINVEDICSFNICELYLSSIIDSVIHILFSIELFI